MTDKNIILLFLLPFLLSACGVPQKAYNEQELALQDCRAKVGVCERDRKACLRGTTELEQEARQCYGKAADLDQDLRNCEEQRDMAETSLNICREAAQTASAQVTDLEAREAQLREKLKTEIAERNVEIERLRDQLSVRVLDSILFDSGSAIMRDEGRTVIDKVGQVIAQTTDRVRVEGHTDNVPISAELQYKYPSNWELAGARAASVVRYLQNAHGLSPLRLEAVGLSEYHPVAPNDTEANRQRNRRVEIILTAPPESSSSAPA